ncbi:MAG: HNH endonuclease, partial [Waterburya sp.]
WIKSGGRCQFRGCNKLLYRDDLTKIEKNSSYFAHIVADSPGGVRQWSQVKEIRKKSILT